MAGKGLSPTENACGRAWRCQSQHDLAKKSWYVGLICTWHACSSSYPPECASAYCCHGLDCHQSYSQFGRLIKLVLPVSSSIVAVNFLPTYYIGSFRAILFSYTH